MSAFRNIEDFLLARVSHRPVRLDDWIGISSNAMLEEAMSGRPVDEWDYPRDIGDLSRCCATFALAPYELKEKMLPRLTKYCEYAVNGWSRTLPPAPQKEHLWVRILHRALGS
jgi:hypothetical protein